jgi:ornithine cyclodeaminase
LLTADDIHSGMHITAVGSDGVGKQELDAEILRKADVIAVDSLDQCRRLGELQHALDLSDRAVELGAIASGAPPGRTTDHQITVADLTGVGVQDVAAAAAVLANAPQTAGSTIEI